MSKIRSNSLTVKLFRKLSVDLLNLSLDKEMRKASECESIVFMEEISMNYGELEWSLSTVDCRFHSKR